MQKIYILLFLFSSLYSQDLGELDIEATTDRPQQNVAEDVFSTPEYFESNSYMPHAPGQKRLTTEEAMFIPGVQGDPVKALLFVGGVSSASNGYGSGGELYIYASKPEESSYNINHLPIGYLFHMGGLHSVIDPNSIDQIDAYLAGFDSSYGNAMGGVIDITPKYPSGELSGYGHLGIYDASVGLNVPLNDDTSFFIGARRSYFDIGYNLVGKPQSEDTNDTIVQFPNYYDITFMLTHNINDENIFSLELISADDKAEFISADNSVKDPKATGDIGIHNGFTSVGARVQTMSGNYNANSLLYYMYSYSNLKLFDDYYLENKSKTFGLFHESTLSYDAHKLSFGVELTRDSIPLDMNITQPPTPENPDFDFTTAPSYVIDRTIDVDSAVIFLQDMYSITKKFTLRYGARFSYTNYQDFGSFIDPRVSALYQFDRANTASFSVGKYTQTPAGYKTTPEMGNPNLSYERATHYVLHYDYTPNKKTSFSIEPFYKEYDALAIDDNVTLFEDSGEGYAYGVDTSIKYRDGDWYGFLAYTYIRSKRQLDTNSPKSDFYAEIPHTLQLVGAKRFWDNWVFSTLMQYHTGSLYTPIIGTYNDAGRVRAIYGEPYSQRLSDYFTLNLKIAQTIKFAHNESLEWSFEFMNVTNHQNVIAYTYDDNYNKTGVETDLPFLPWFDVTYRF